MDESFKIDDAPRPNVNDNLAGLPLVTLAWRTMRSEYKRCHQEEESRKNTLLDMVEEVLKLRAMAVHKESSGEEKPGITTEKVHQAADNLQAILARLGMEIIAPQGEPYTPARMQFFENIAQVTKPVITEPLIDEIVQPAIMYRGDLCRMGKAVIALPMDIGKLFGESHQL